MSVRLALARAGELYMLYIPSDQHGLFDRYRSLPAYQAVRQHDGGSASVSPTELLDCHWRNGALNEQKTGRRIENLKSVSTSRPQPDNLETFVQPSAG